MGSERRIGSPGRVTAGSPARTVFVVIAVVGATLATVSLVLPRVTAWPVLSDPSSPLVRFVDVRAEANLHTWFNVAVLTVAALLHGCVGALARSAGRTWWPWAVLSLALSALAIDDLASLHEQLEPWGRALGGGGGALHFAWLVPGGVLAVGLAMTAVTTARQLPAAAARWLLGGILALLGAALGAEALGGALLDRGEEIAYIVVSHVEEFVETVAAGMLLCAAVSVLAIRRGPRPGTMEVSYDDVLTT
jgi:hypothetical protein